MGREVDRQDWCNVRMFEQSADDTRASVFVNVINQLFIGLMETGFRRATL